MSNGGRQSWEPCWCNVATLSSAFSILPGKIPRVYNRGVSVSFLLLRANTLTQERRGFICLRLTDIEGSQGGNGRSNLKRKCLGVGALSPAHPGAGDGVSQQGLWNEASRTT